MKIVVLCGGVSAERDVSIVSGTLAAKALLSRGHDVVLMDLYFGYNQPYDMSEEIFTRELVEVGAAIGEKAPDIEEIKKMRTQNNSSRVGDNVIEICRAADIVFLALHGEDGEDGKIQALFDLEGIKYTGTGALGSAIAMNKDVSKRLLEQAGVKTPRGAVVSRDTSESSPVGFPCFVKPCSRGSSVGASIANSEDEYKTALAFAFEYDDKAIVEQYIKGRECDVGVIAGRALPVIEICPKTGFYDYKNKYQSGMTDEFCPANLPEKITEKLLCAAERVFETLLFDVYGRMDFIVDEGGEIYCLEGNTLPGLTPLSLLPQEAAVTGMSYAELCETIVRESLKKYETEKR